jgi:hypothetical protein
MSGFPGARTLISRETFREGGSMTLLRSSGILSRVVCWFVPTRGGAAILVALLLAVTALGYQDYRIELTDGFFLMNQATPGEGHLLTSSDPFESVYRISGITAYCDAGKFVLGRLGEGYFIFSKELAHDVRRRSSMGEPISPRVALSLFPSSDGAGWQKAAQSLGIAVPVKLVQPSRWRARFEPMLLVAWAEAVVFWLPFHAWMRRRAVRRE